MKILLLNRGILPVSTNLPSGTEFVAYNLAKRLAERGHEVHFITDINETEKTRLPENLHLCRIQCSSRTFPRMLKLGFPGWVVAHFLGNLILFKSAHLLLRKENWSFDIIHGYGNMVSLLLCYCKKRIPLVYTEEDATPWMCKYRVAYERLFRKFAYNFLDVGVFRKVQHTIVLYGSAKIELTSRWKIPDKKITVIPNGVDLNRFRPSDSEILDKGNQELGIGYCLFVGRLTSRKGVDYLLMAIDGLDIKCVIIGEGPQKRNLISLSQKLKLRRKIFFIGNIPNRELSKYYSRSSFLVLPSVSEGLPLVALEAMACGKPVIASRISGLPTIVRDGYNGFLVEPRDIRGLRAKIRDLASDRHLAKKLGRNARTFVEKEFGWDSVAEKTINLYEKVIAGGEG